jgi:hypothetical protein
MKPPPAGMKSTRRALAVVTGLPFYFRQTARERLNGNCDRAQSIRILPKLRLVQVAPCSSSALFLLERYAAAERSIQPPGEGA